MEIQTFLNKIDGGRDLQTPSQPHQALILDSFSKVGSAQNSENLIKPQAQTSAQKLQIFPSQWHFIFVPPW